MLKSIHSHPLATMVILTVAGMCAILTNMIYLSRDISEASAMQYAQSYLESINKVHSFYSSQIVSRIKPQGIKLRTDYMIDESKKSVPYPATFSIEFSKKITSKDGLMATRLFSYYPFKLRKNGGIKNKYEEAAIKQFETAKKQGKEIKPYVAFEEINGKRILHYAIPVIMKQGCVNCHNAHSESVKTDWKVGDIRGARMLNYPINNSVAMASNGWVMTLVTMLTITLISLTFIFIIISALRKSISTLSETNKSIQRYVPKEFLKIMGKESILDVELGDNLEKEMTPVFTDIRNFTPLSETLSPEDNFKLLNAYLSRMGPVIRKHNGFIDKYIGDAIMALFPNPDDAVKASIEMQNVLEEYNAYRKSKDRIPMKVGIGINTGTLRLGTIGEIGRMEGTVISDAVNLAARIESLTKMYGADLLISNHTLEKLKEISKENMRLIDTVIVKGRTEPVELYEVLDADHIDTRFLKKKDSGIYRSAYEHYMNRRFKDAEVLFADILQNDPNDKPASILLERCRYHIKHGAPDDWTGIIKLDEK